MTRLSTWLGALAMAGGLAATASAQAPVPQNGVITYDSLTSLKQQYAHVRDELLKMADLMPEDAYAFQPVPTVRTFAGDVGHIASSNIGQCGAFLDKKHPLSSAKLEETLKAKTESVEALKASFALCDEFMNTLETRGNLMDGMFSRTGTRAGQQVTVKMGYAGSIAALIAHNNEMYGYMSMYLRLKGLVPPSSSK